jgi:hypothetical protein
MTGLQMPGRVVRVIVPQWAYNYLMTHEPEEYPFELSFGSHAVFGVIVDEHNNSLAIMVVQGPNGEPVMQFDL